MPGDSTIRLHIQLIYADFTVPFTQRKASRHEPFRLTRSSSIPVVTVTEMRVRALYLCLSPRKACKVRPKPPISSCRYFLICLNAILPTLASAGPNRLFTNPHSHPFLHNFTASALYFAMFSKNSVAVFTALLCSSVASALSVVSARSTTTYLEATTLVTKNNASAFECWRFASPLSTSTGAGTAGASTLLIDNLANATYTVIPPRFEGGVHNAPHPQ